MSKYCVKNMCNMMAPYKHYLLVTITVYDDDVK